MEVDLVSWRQNSLECWLYEGRELFVLSFSLQHRRQIMVECMRILQMVQQFFKDYTYISFPRWTKKGIFRVFFRSEVFDSELNNVEVDIKQNILCSGKVWAGVFTLKKQNKVWQWLLKKGKWCFNLFKMYKMRIFLSLFTFLLKFLFPFLLFMNSKLHYVRWVLPVLTFFWRNFLEKLKFIFLRCLTCST